MEGFSHQAPRILRLSLGIAENKKKLLFFTEKLFSKNFPINFSSCESAPFGFDQQLNNL